MYNFNKMFSNKKVEWKAWSCCLQSVTRVTDRLYTIYIVCTHSIQSMWPVLVMVDHVTWFSMLIHSSTLSWLQKELFSSFPFMKEDCLVGEGENCMSGPILFISDRGIRLLVKYMDRTSSSEADIRVFLIPHSAILKHMDISSSITRGKSTCQHV